MTFIYSDQKDSTFNPGSVNYYAMDGVRHYITHLENYLYLQFVRNHKDSSRSDKEQALKELGIANRKCDFWYKITKSQKRLPELRRAELDKLAIWHKDGHNLTIPKRK